MEAESFHNPPIAPVALPAVADQPYHALNPAYRTVALAGTLILMLFLLGGLITGFTLGQLWGHPLIAGGALLLWAGLTVLFMVLQHHAFRRKAYALRARDITYRHGLIAHKVTTIPFIRVQHAEVGQGPLERLFGLAHLNIYTAGGSSSDLSLPGLSPQRAAQLKDFILRAESDPIA